MQKADVTSGTSGLWGKESRLSHNCSRSGSSPLYILGALLLSLLMATACNKSPTPGEPPPPPPAASISLTAEAGVIEAWLTVWAEGLTPDPQNLQVVLERDGAERLRFAAVAETTVVDTGLLPAHTYTYTAVLEKDGHTAVRSNSVELTTMDTTSHNFSWQIYEFGGVHGSSVLYDVAIISPTDIWAVGEIHTAETDTFDSTGNWVPPYNAVHWDGSEWELKHIYVEYRGQPNWAPLKGVFALPDGQIIFSSGLPYLPENDHWKLYHLWDMGVLGQNDGSVDRIWGTSLNNLFFVGRSGTIVHYDGSSWRRIESGTDVGLLDVWGTLEGQTVWSCGYSSDATRTVLVKIVDLQVRWRYEDRDHINVFRPDSLSGLLVGVYVDRPQQVFICSGAGLYLASANTHGEAKRIGPGDWFFRARPRRMRASLRNNIFITGDFSMIWHFNGLTWYEERQFAGRLRLRGIALKGNMVIFAGLDVQTNRAVIIRGNRI